MTVGIGKIVEIGKINRIDKIGKVYIIGAGPGDYKLLTLKAAQCIGKADVIVYDRLVNSKILSFAKNTAEFIYVGKMPDHHTVPQEAINEILVEKASEGKTVARVKGGDPFMFGRGGEEALSLFENGIEFEIIPGVTSAISVPAYAGIPVTHRDYCSSLHIITGHEKPEKEPGFIDYEVIARLEGTLVFLMSAKNLSEICINLVKFGKVGTTPVAVIENGTTFSQRTITGTLENIVKRVNEADIKSPAVTVIGRVVDLREKLDWFSKGRLAGKRIIVTRAGEQADKLVEAIEELGGEALEFPVIKIEEPFDYVQFDKILHSLENYKWLVFTSINGVNAFFKRMKECKIDIRSLWGIRLCAVGEGTAKGLELLGLRVDYMPEIYTTAELLKGLLKKVQSGEKVLLARADIASEELVEGLKNSRLEYDDIVVYRTVIETTNNETTNNETTNIETTNREKILKLIEDKKVDYITFTSSSTVKNFVSIIGCENIAKLSDIGVVCIGPVTMKTAEESGLKVSAMADVYTIEGLLEKLIEISGEAR